jgi:hypothetical protein
MTFKYLICLTFKIFIYIYHKMSLSDITIITLAAATIVGLSIFSNSKGRKEGYGNANYPTNPQFYAKQISKNPLGAYKSPNAYAPAGSQKMNMDNSGSQLLSYQLYQQAVNAATPTTSQLNSISGQSQEQTGNSVLDGGLSSNTAPYAMLNDGGPQMYASEFQAVNLGSERAQSISACAQNAPTFVATSLLPKPAIPGQQAWDVTAPNNILANQNFLSATQQIGLDTTLSSTKNQSWDIRGNPAPNPINVVSPWNNTDIMPDLERRPLVCQSTQDQGIYGCASSRTDWVGQ